MWLNDPYISENEFKMIKTPILILAGDNDAISYEHLIEMKGLLKNSQLCILPNAGHGLLAEKPDIANKICLDFLKE
jgi:pimeloyl-ACP methyl ester carboxylesterase